MLIAFKYRTAAVISLANYSGAKLMGRMQSVFRNQHKQHYREHGPR
jgi:hypothetical protein